MKEIIEEFKEYCAELKSKKKIVCANNPWNKLVSKDDKEYLKLIPDVNLSDKAGMYFMIAVEGIFMYPKTSKVYYIGRAKNIRSRLSGKMRADFQDEVRNLGDLTNPRISTDCFSGTVYHYYSSTFYEYFNTNLCWFELSPELSNYYDDIEDIILAAFQIRYGSTPMCNKKSAKREICFDPDYTDDLCEIAELLFERFK